MSRPKVRKNNLISHLSNVTQRGVYQAVKFLVTWACFVSRVNVISREVSSNLIGQKKKKTIKLIPSFWEAKFVTICLFILFTNLWVSFTAVNDYQKAKNINEHLHKVRWSALFFCLQRLAWMSRK